MEGIGQINPIIFNELLKPNKLLIYIQSLAKFNESLFIYIQKKMSLSLT
jgi:hypothetical protein